MGRHEGERKKTHPLAPPCEGGENGKVKTENGKLKSGSSEYSEYSEYSESSEKRSPLIRSPLIRSSAPRFPLK